MDKKIKMQLAAIPSEEEGDDVESDNELRNSKVIPNETYCLP